MIDANVLFERIEFVGRIIKKLQGSMGIFNRRQLDMLPRLISYALTLDKEGSRGHRTQLE